MSIPDIDFSFIDPEDRPQVTYPNKSKSMSKGIGKLVESREIITNEVNEVVDRATAFGYDLGVMDEQLRIADLIESMLRLAQDGELEIIEALVTLSKMTVKDDDVE